MRKVKALYVTKTYAKPKHGSPLKGTMIGKGKDAILGDTGARRNAIFVFFLTYTGYLSLYGTRKPFSVVKTSMQTDLRLSTFSLGYIDTAFLSSYAVGQMIIPLLGDWFGIRPIIFISYVGSSICSFGFGSASTAYVLSSLWFMNGLFHAAVFPLLVKSVASCFSSDSRGQALGLWTTSQQVGSMAATAFSAYMSSLISWRAAFIAPAFVVGIYGLILFALLPEPHHGANKDKLSAATSGDTNVSPSDMAVEMYEMPDSTKARTILQDKVGKLNRQTIGSSGKQNSHISQDEWSGPTIPHPQRAPTLREIIAMPDLLNVAVAYFFIKLIRYSLLFWLPYFISKQLKHDASVAGYSSMMFDIGGIGGAAVTGYVSDHFMRGKRLTAASIMCGATGVALWIFAWSSHIGLAPMLCAMAVLGFAIAGPDSVLGAAAAQDLCDRSHFGSRGLSSAAGVINGMGSTGAVVQGYMTAYVAQNRGWDSVFMTLCVFSIFSLVLLLRPIMSENRLRTAVASPKSTNTCV